MRTFNGPVLWDANRCNFFCCSIKKQLHCYKITGYIMRFMLCRITQHKLSQCCNMPVYAHKTLFGFIVNLGSSGNLRSANGGLRTVCVGSLKFQAFKFVPHFIRRNLPIMFRKLWSKDGDAYSSQEEALANKCNCVPKSQQCVFIECLKIRTFKLFVFVQAAVIRLASAHSRLMMESGRVNTKSEVTPCSLLIFLLNCVVWSQYCSDFIFCVSAGRI